RNLVRATRLALESFPTELVEACSPFEEPSATAPNSLHNGARLQALQDQADCLAAKIALFLLVHAASFAGSMNEMWCSRCVESSLNYVVHDVMNLICSRCHEP